MIKLKIRRGDEVIVTTGRDTGKSGTVTKVFPKDNKAIVAGVNVYLKHAKPTKDSDGGIIRKEMPINISNLAIRDPETGKATKIGYKILEDGTKVRFSKSSGALIGKEGK